jgi:hypothetical protein
LWPRRRVDYDADSHEERGKSPRSAFPSPCVGEGQVGGR